MRVLSIDTSLAVCSVALLDAAEDDVVNCDSMDMERGHAEALVPMIARVAGGREGLRTVERIAVTTGPGSFTGIRVGLSAARGLALATGLPLIGITTLAVLAAPALSEGDGHVVGAAIDARHGRVFFQIFSPNGRGLVPARLMSAKDAARVAGDAPMRLVGNGAPIVAGASGDVVHDVDATALAPDAVWLARLGAASAIPDRAPRPVYLRAADAKPQTGGRVARA
ncbi:tRNA (adenosine(37)-N6)-threonylcarbamoyltransferase complex dimerization subunit type 1 TsaB [Terrihabitans rhizophilus]|uniref:tRNA (Adenosine(37)-N6)-threonylcarbamoyltransferase complex dimerization subunit type 1 TsaB n=1 Tax=Terrihabitans rhizophilus TaxID=3092662 RepID=A0ABU4RRN1_9HYPH|nr:tRNA (adenosine(37)-N6)-threonylcarbamoyltransferase complex dimerization subunit type 1 TsaB [Terrihabitans sp. PJ23]MDX6807509.1 tRNA (adenosine(37)-N6)-threonylcarbamoyltransferase complex dimerization subunit type 1 TsaB [Terrihabitans sp. PJ23]